MTYEESLSLKPGDLIVVKSDLFWFNDLKWDKINDRLFVIFDIIHDMSGGPNPEVEAVHTCSNPNSHDFQFNTLFEGRIICIAVCPGNIRLLSKGQSSDAR